MTLAIPELWASPEVTQLFPGAGLQAGVLPSLSAPANQA